ncbi:BppU family phage baseplate upper protein [Enterococcus faecium]|uniref:BppU family phage baseplate upper protein n=1 Tax=Enterococcus faecium TaxID=1352 RepID=UPI002072D2B6|nr:BppU family phage baseplate upper protein [Enterococcus faecium]MCM6870420.1 BppU family phage baseplate upper protein [Enterococcus faecium]MCM6876019.1 BppU family phage baseplate upper protein [Enterococcus faecium]MCM6888695.1 BppU family phage baseplate upper protein [Enterococcus faecium]MCM6891695.1 BppU family phage baseplate upper protein [Enterococcus faecium]MCM6910934.1 BppU family phage baseplate upper protein [Enterococcus faecium]
MVYKTNESIIVIQAEATNPNNTDVVFWSHDRGTAKLRMKLVRKNGIPQSLPEGTTVPIRLMFRSATAEGGYGKHDYLAAIEDRVNGIVSIVLEDNILGYVGTVEGSVYIDFPNDRSLDTAGRFTFDIKRSPIDDSTPELEDYYFNGFSQTIDKIEKILADGKLEIEKKIAESETQIDTKLKDTNDKITKANQDVATLNTNIDKANDRIDQTNQQIGDLGKLKKMYSNSIDFGGYDYSGNPNLMRVIKASDFRRQGDSDVLISDIGYNSIRLTSQKVNHLWTYTETGIPSLVSGKTYTISAKVKIEEGTTGNIDKLTVSYRKVKGGTILLTAISDGAVVGKEIIIKGTGVVNYEIAELSMFYLDIGVDGVINGSVIVSDVKIEAGSTATPYQPNLLDAPYYLSKVALGENIANKSVAFPIKSSAYEIYNSNMKEGLVIGQTYIITLKGTKPASQTFVAYNCWNINLGNLKPVEGLTDVWSLTFTPTYLETTAPKDLRIYQYPQSTVGACQIDWLKIEKGNTRTPNISEYKYFGEGLKDSNNPNDYSWDVTPEYTEKGLNNTVSLTEPETVLGLKNFSDGIQIAGDRVVSENDHVVYTLNPSNSKSFSDGYATFIKHGKTVIVNGTVKLKKAYPFGTTLDDVLPAEFIARIVHGMLTGHAGTASISKSMYVRKDLGTIVTNSEFAANEWFTFHGNYWVGEE